MDSHGRKTILLVEDNAILALAEQALIARGGMDVLIARSGEQAIGIVADDPTVDLVLMDVDLGRGIDGTEAAARILTIANFRSCFSRDTPNASTWNA